ncbi:PAS domain-containing sensor histidine kinase [Luteolibacter arcticus]|uniref:histidine kinase n=1 Tax=Luteolibacter arcticus TaxID=1581411 RepID=A0ABT3GIB8_9BACT|nr:PAS domain-containing sensor histidine kinase [Luteolibacter arcticus]MCW1923268.1 PAS domain-containing sensor histidine kinase [Luteolibacter arcticus]
MPEPFATLSTVAALAALTALGITALRLRRARKEFNEEVSAWKMKLDLDLRQAKRERDQLLDALGDAFMLVDANARVLFANKAARTLFRGRDLTGRTVQEAFLDQRLAAALMRCLETGEPTVTRAVLPQQSSPLGDQERRGMNAWVIDAARLSDSPADDPTTRVVIRDVTSEYQTEQIRKDFVANASHELRTPLAIINGYLENLIDDDLLDDKELTRRFLKVMRKHTERISRIVEDMLVISRLESGEAAALKVKPFRLRSCISDVLERLESVIHNQQATIKIDMPDLDMILAGDRFYWTQVLFNLVENALKQNPRPKLTVTIGCSRDEESTRVWVADDGVGIPSADLPHIFRRFYRVEKHHSQEEIKGTGLGLSIVKRAIEAHGGAIRVSSTPGQETRFTMEVPREAEARLLAEAEANALPELQKTEG